MVAFPGRRPILWRWTLPFLLALSLASAGTAALNTTVPLSAQSATGMAVSLFPVALKLDGANLFMTEPQVLFLDSKRLGIRSRFQAYDHRPAEGIAVSETGTAMLSAEVDYDRATRQVMLRNMLVEELQFDRNNAATRNFATVLRTAWSREVANPIRFDLPPHPYLLPIKDNIDDISYDGQYISLILAY